MASNAEQELIRRILLPDIADDPEAFVMYAFPWGKKGTPLERHSGPRTWQRKVLVAMREFIAAMQAHDYSGAADKLEVFRKAIASGRGIGKSALIAWIIYWFMSTRIGGTCIVSANTETQLRTVTWGELGKWHAMLINKHWFDISATALKPAKWFDELVQGQLKRGTKYYYAEAKLWSEENPDAYAGAHNPLGMLLVFDEASGIVTPIWTVAEGYFTEPIVDRFWLAFSNPRSVSGAFFDCFGRNRKFWRTDQIDARTVEGTDKQIYEKIIEQYGDDSDEARVEVYGQFPRVGTNQFIPLDLVRMAQDRELVEDKEAPLLMGVDVARFGDDESVITFRRGRDARSKKQKTYKGVDTSTLAMHVANAIECENPDAVFVDGAGVGGGVIDRLRQLGYRVIEVQSGEKADASDKYLNKRVEMWGLMREWLKTGCLTKNEQLENELIAPEYEITPKGQVKLETKENMKKRGVASPDCFVAGTMILTPTGEKPINSFSVGDEVVTPMGVSRVIHVWETETDNLTKVAFSSGRTLTGKGKHEVFTWDRGWVRLDSIALTNAIETSNLWRRFKWKLLNTFFTRANDLGFKRQVGTISLEGKMRRRDFFIGASGLTTSGLFLKACKSIIKTAIGETTKYQTLNLSLAGITSGNIWSNECRFQNSAKKQLKDCEITQKKQLNGTSQSMVLSGTRKMGSRHGLEESRPCQFVQFAEKNMKRFSQVDQDFARTHANKKNPINVIRRLSGFACNAAKNMFSINIGDRNVVPVSVQASCEPSAVKVYNLTLDRENVYYANGILVSNCADALALTFAHKVGYKADLSREKIKRESAFDRRNEWFGGRIDGGWMI